MKTAARLAVAACLLGGLCAARWAFGNGGPFVVRYPNGDPAANGVLARLDPTLKPAQETRLRVIKEDLTICFVPETIPAFKALKRPPLVEISAAYSIENPTGQEVQVDFGFPILRGIHLKPGAVPYRDVNVQVDKYQARCTVISNADIYGTIRRNAREIVEKGIASNPELARRAAGVRAAWIVPDLPKQKKAASANSDPEDFKRQIASLYESDTDRVRRTRRPTDECPAARESLRTFLMTKLGWNARDAALLVEYVSLKFAPQLNDDPLDIGNLGTPNFVASVKGDALWPDDVASANLDALWAIGEQRATQLFAQLASRFDKDSDPAYDAIFTAWGGDVRERSIDLMTGQIRPRELTLSPRKGSSHNDPSSDDYYLRYIDDPTVYARVDYLDPDVKIAREEKASCQAILKNLPVTFTFAPMNLLYYQAKFPARKTRTVTVSYRQYAYADTRGAGSYQLAYVLHPATLWREFGPINVTLQVPKGVACKASAVIQEVREVRAKRGFKADETDDDEGQQSAAKTYPATVYQATLTNPEQKSGELFAAVDKAAWDAMFPPANPKPNPPQSQQK